MRGSSCGRSRAAASRPHESPEQAAVRETAEEVGLEVKAVRVLGDRVHPNTGVHMTYVACEPISGTAVVGDADEIAEVAWVAHGDIPVRVPYGLFPQVQEYLDGALPVDPRHTRAPPAIAAGGAFVCAHASNA